MAYKHSFLIGFTPLISFTGPPIKMSANICFAFHFKELKSAQVDRDAMKEQAEGLQGEYDRVCSLLKQAEVNFYHFSK